jgi:hypothetical protein
LKSTDVSEERIASIFRLEELAEQALATYFDAGFLLCLIFDPEDADDIFIRNVG